jgi:hypothetical protein
MNTIRVINRTTESGSFYVPIFRDQSGGLLLPRKGETIRVNGIAYVVQEVVWDYIENESGEYDEPVVTVVAK